MKKRLPVLLLVLTLACAPVMAQEADPAALIPASMQTAAMDEPVALFSGPTQGFYRHQDQTIDLSRPFVCFGQYDCWTMVAQGTPDCFGPVGWIEGGLFDETGVAQLSFEDSFAAMVEETAPMTDNPQSADGAWGTTLERGAEITVLACYGDWLYVQTEIDAVPARAFIPASAL